MTWIIHVNKSSNLLESPSLLQSFSLVRSFRKTDTCLLFPPEEGASSSVVVVANSSDYVLRVASTAVHRLRLAASIDDPHRWLLATRLHCQYPAAMAVPFIAGVEFWYLIRKWGKPGVHVLHAKIEDARQTIPNRKFVNKNDSCSRLSHLNWSNFISWVCIYWEGQVLRVLLQCAA